MPEIKIENLNFSYKKSKKISFPVLKDLNVVFQNEKINVIMGYSGCGKTTLLRTILGLEQYEGNIYFDGININKLSIKDRNVSYVNQNITLLPHLTAFENIAFPLKVIHAPEEEIRSRIKEVSTLLNIDECLSRLPKELSIGQCQRVLIAKAIIKKPLVCIFDEPFSNLDKPIADSLSVEFKKIFKQLNTTVIFVSHNVEQAYKLADYLYIMDEGQIIIGDIPNKVAMSNDVRVQELLHK